MWKLSHPAVFSQTRGLILLPKWEWQNWLILYSTYHSSPSNFIYLFIFYIKRQHCDYLNSPSEVKIWQSHSKIKPAKWRREEIRSFKVKEICCSLNLLNWLHLWWNRFLFCFSNSDSHLDYLICTNNLSICFRPKVNFFLRGGESESSTRLKLTRKFPTLSSCGSSPPWTASVRTGMRKRFAFLAVEQSGFRLDRFMSPALGAQIL